MSEQRNIIIIKDDTFEIIRHQAFQYCHNYCNYDKSILELKIESDFNAKTSAETLQNRYIFTIKTKKDTIITFTADFECSNYRYIETYKYDSTNNKVIKLNKVSQCKICTIM